MDSEYCSKTAPSNELKYYVKSKHKKMCNTLNYQFKLFSSAMGKLSEYIYQIRYTSVENPSSVMSENRKNCTRNFCAILYMKHRIYIRNLTYLM